MKRKTLAVGIITGSLGLFGTGVGYAAAAPHTAQALEHARVAAKQSTVKGIQEHAQVALTHVQAAEKAKEAGTEHLSAAETQLNVALKAKDANSAKEATENAESHLLMIK